MMRATMLRLHHRKADNKLTMRYLPLLDFKYRLRSLAERGSRRLLCCDHVRCDGEGLFRQAWEHDVEGVVAKWKPAPSTPAANELAEDPQPQLQPAAEEYSSRNLHIAEDRRDEEDCKQCGDTECPGEENDNCQSTTRLLFPDGQPAKTCHGRCEHHRKNYGYINQQENGPKDSTNVQQQSQYRCEDDFPLCAR